jgi:hypothetical protein
MFVRDKNGRATYISWWPAPNTIASVEEGGHRRIPHPKIPYAYDAYPVARQSYKEDREIEGQEADHSFKISGLDEEKVIDFYEELTLEKGGVRKSGPLKPWSALDLNCSTVVLEGLKAGGASNYAMNYWFSKYWTPNRVMEYARNVKHVLDSKPPEM